MVQDQSYDIYAILLTKASAGGFVIENKTISRKHLIVEVGAVKPDDSVGRLLF